MTMILLIAGGALVALGAALFVVGTIGVLRLPDALSRFHALTKIDNLALGCVCLGLVLMADDAITIMILLFVWILAMISGAIAAQLVAGHHGSDR